MGAKTNILKYIELRGIKKLEFYHSIGVANGFLDKGDGIVSDKLEKILKVYPDINPEWLLTGEGPMLREGGDKIQVTGDNNKSAIGQNIDQSDGKDGKLEAEVERLKSENDLLKQLVKSKEDMIDVLRNK